MFQSWRNGKVFDIERFRCTISDIRHSNAFRERDRIVRIETPYNADIDCVNRAIVDEGGTVPDSNKGSRKSNNAAECADKDIESRKKRGITDSDKECSEEKDLVRLVRLEVEKRGSNVTPIEDEDIYRNAPNYPADFATWNCVTRPGFPFEYPLMSW